MSEIVEISYEDALVFWETFYASAKKSGYIMTEAESLGYEIDCIIKIIKKKHCL